MKRMKKFSGLKADFDRLVGPEVYEMDPVE